MGGNENRRKIFLMTKKVWKSWKLFVWKNGFRQSISRWKTVKILVFIRKSGMVSYFFSQNEVNYLENSKVLQKTNFKMEKKSENERIPKWIWEGSCTENFPILPFKTLPNQSLNSSKWRRKIKKSFKCLPQKSILVRDLTFQIRNLSSSENNMEK